MKNTKTHIFDIVDSEEMKNNIKNILDTHINFKIKDKDRLLSINQIDKGDSLSEKKDIIIKFSQFSYNSNLKVNSILQLNSVSYLSSRIEEIERKSYLSSDEFKNKLNSLGLKRTLVIDVFVTHKLNTFIPEFNRQLLDFKLDFFQTYHISLNKLLEQNNINLYTGRLYKNNYNLSSNFWKIFIFAQENKIDLFFIFNKIVWEELLLRFAYENIYISGGSPNKRHLLSYNQYVLSLFLVSLNLDFKTNIKKESVKNHFIKVLSQKIIDISNNELNSPEFKYIIQIILIKITYLLKHLYTLETLINNSLIKYEYQNVLPFDGLSEFFHIYSENKTENKITIEGLEKKMYNKLIINIILKKIQNFLDKNITDRERILNEGIPLFILINMHALNIKKALMMFNLLAICLHISKDLESNKKDKISKDKISKVIKELTKLIKDYKLDNMFTMDQSKFKFITNK